MLSRVTIIDINENFLSLLSTLTIFITLFSSLPNTHEFQRIETRVKIKENGSSTSITVSQTEGRKTDKSVDELHNNEIRSVIRDIVKISLSLSNNR